VCFDPRYDVKPRHFACCCF